MKMPSAVACAPFQCNGPGREISLTAGSRMERRKSPLTTSFPAICIICRAKAGLSAMAIRRRLGVNQPDARLLHHKIDRAIAR